MVRNRTVVRRMIARPLLALSRTFWELYISLELNELNALQFVFDLASFRSTWKQLQDFSQANGRSLGWIVNDNSCSVLWDKLAQRNRQRADDMYRLERFADLSCAGERESLQFILDTARKKWSGEKALFVSTVLAQAPGYWETLRVIHAEHEKTSALLTSTVKEYNESAAESHDLPVSKKVKAEFVTGAEVDIAGIKSKLSELLEAKDEIIENIRRLASEYERLFGDIDEDEEGLDGLTESELLEKTLF